MKFPFRAHRPKTQAGADAPQSPAEPSPKAPAVAPKGAATPEIGGRDGPEPTRYGDWEVNGRCTEF